MKIGQATIITTGLAALALCIGAVTRAQASYIDPGSAGYLFQLAIAGLFGLVYSLRMMLVRRRRITSSTPGNNLHSGDAMKNEDKTVRGIQP